MDLFKSNPRTVLKTTHKIYMQFIYNCSNNILKKKTEKLSFGRYLSLRRNKIDTAIKNFNHNKVVLEISKIHTKYLNKIIQDCAKNNLKLVFISTPLHNYYVKSKKNSRDFLQKYIAENLSEYT